MENYLAEWERLWLRNQRFSLKKVYAKCVFIMIEFSKHVPFDLLREDGLQSWNRSPEYITLCQLNINVAWGLPKPMSRYKRIAHHESSGQFCAWTYFQLKHRKTYRDVCVGRRVGWRFLFIALWVLVWFGRAALFEFGWPVLLPVFSSLLRGFARKTFSAPCKKMFCVLSQSGFLHFPL